MKKMTPKEKGQFLIDNFKDENGDLDLSDVDLSDFDGNVNASGWKVKRSLDQSRNEVGGGLNQDGQNVKGIIFYDYDSLHNDFATMSPAERGEFIIRIFSDRDGGTIFLDNVDLSDYRMNVDLSLWKVNGDLYQDHQEVKGELYQDNQKVKGSLHQGNQQAGWMEQAAEGAICQDPIQGKKKMTPKEKGRFLLEHFKGEDGALELDRVDLLDFEGDVVICGWKVGGDLFLDHQEVMGSLFQNNQKVRRNLFQDEQEAGGYIAQDMQEPNAQEAEDIPVGPDYESECERLQKELCEANRKNEILLWALGNAMEGSR